MVGVLTVPLYGFDIHLDSCVHAAHPTDSHPLIHWLSRSSIFISLVFSLALLGVGASTLVSRSFVKRSAANLVPLAVPLGKNVECMSRSVGLGKRFGDVDLQTGK